MRQRNEEREHGVHSMWCDTAYSIMCLMYTKQVNTRTVRRIHRVLEEFGVCRKNYAPTECRNSLFPVNLINTIISVERKRKKR